MIAADLVEQSEAVGAGHHDVREDEVVVGVLLEPCYGLFRALDGCGGVTALFEQGCGYSSYRFFVVYDQDSFRRHDFSIGGGNSLVIFWKILF